MTGINIWTIDGRGFHTVAIEEFEATILADSGNVADDTGYERLLLFTRWNSWADDQIGKVSIRIDQHPGGSYCKFYVWHSTLGWLEQGKIPTAQFWTYMPGFHRATTERAGRATRVLAKQAIAQLRVTADEIHRARTALEEMHRR